MLATPSGTPETAGPPMAEKITRGHSCILCQQRKVKCDKQKPKCGNCIKARAECIPSAPSLPRRRKRRLAETDLAGRLRKYEHLLKSHGIKIDDEEVEKPGHHEGPLEEDFENKVLSMNVPRRRPLAKGALFADKDKSYYVENTLWENLREEIGDPKDSLQGSSEDESNDAGPFPYPESLLVGFASSKDLSAMHPPPVQIFRLWQTFLANVNPLAKMVHHPTLQQTILDACEDIRNIPRHVEALMFSVYFLAVTSLQNDECQSMFGEQRNILVARYAHCTQQALINARFLKSLNIGTLQAYVLFLLGVRSTYDPYSLWVLTGASVRIAQRLGLHRDGSNHNISPFDAEIRRRTWWQVVFLDGHSSKLAGAGFPAWLAKFDTQIPKNISDSDLSPTMKEPPQDKEGATEMIFCCLRYETAQALRTSRTTTNMDGSWGITAGSSPELLAEKDKAIDELEIRFEKRFVQHCDPSIPLHLLVIYMAKSVICTMRIMAHHPRQFPDKGASMSQREKDMLFTESLKEMEYDSLGYTSKSMKGYLWHITSHFQLDAFIYLISELRYRTSGDLVERAWQQIRFSYENRPELISDTKNTLYSAIGNLALKAWAKREEAMGSYQAPPRFISLLRSQRNIPDPPRPDTQKEDAYATPRTTEFHTEALPVPVASVPLPPPPPPQNTDFTNIEQQWGNWNPEVDVNMPEITPVDWAYWQTLMDGDLPAWSGDAGGDLNMGQQW